MGGYRFARTFEAPWRVDGDRAAWRRGIESKPNRWTEALAPEQPCAAAGITADHGDRAFDDICTAQSDLGETRGERALRRPASPAPARFSKAIIAPELPPSATPAPGMTSPRPAPRWPSI